MAILLPTSTAGSLPKPSWLAEPEKLWSPWKLEGEALLEAKQDALRLSLQEQLHAGIDIVSDGEQTRQHFVTTFIEHLDGVDFEKRETVRIRNRYDASVPSVVGAVSRQKPVFVEDAIRLCNRFQVEFNPQWSVRRMREVHDDLAGRERAEWYTDRNKNFNKIAKFDYFNVLTSEFVDDKVQTIKARILANGEEVIQEGIRQKHCVASYTRSCYNNKYIVVSIYDGVIRSTVGIVTSSYYNTNAKELNFSIQQHYASCNKEAPEEHKEFAQKILDILNTDAKLEAVKNIFEKKGD